jgi:choline dehydrogenase-like flavoprotein
LPVARTTYHPHRHELAASAYYAPKLEAILKEAGAIWSQSTTSPRLGSFIEGLSPEILEQIGTDFLEEQSQTANIPTSRHVVGTVRMGTDPATSVCDEWGRLHDVPNVLIADSSPFPTGAGYGPTLTLVALSIRNSRAFAG